MFNLTSSKLSSSRFIPAYFLLSKTHTYLLVSYEYFIWLDEKVSMLLLVEDVDEGLS